MANHTTGLSLLVKIDDNSKPFKKLLAGRPFMRPTSMINEVWFKIDKNWAQPIDNEVLRRRIDENELIYEVTLVYSGAAAAYTPDGSVIYPETAVAI